MSEPWILILEDDLADADLVLHALRKSNRTDLPKVCSNAQAAVTVIESAATETRGANSHVCKQVEYEHRMDDLVTVFRSWLDVHHQPEPSFTERNRSMCGYKRKRRAAPFARMLIAPSAAERYLTPRGPN